MKYGKAETRQMLEVLGYDSPIKCSYSVEGSSKVFGTKEEAEKYFREKAFKSTKDKISARYSSIRDFQKQIERLRSFSDEADWDDDALRRHWKLAYTPSETTILRSDVSNSSVVFSYKIDSMCRSDLFAMRVAVRHHSKCLIQTMQQQIRQRKAEIKELNRLYAALSRYLKQEAEAK